MLCEKVKLCHTRTQAISPLALTNYARKNLTTCQQANSIVLVVESMGNANIVKFLTTTKGFFTTKIILKIEFSSVGGSFLKTTSMDLFPNEENFDLDKSRQKFHHSLKEHHKISNIPTFRHKFVAKCCKMLII